MKALPYIIIYSKTAKLWKSGVALKSLDEIKGSCNDVDAK